MRKWLPAAAVLVALALIAGVILGAIHGTSEGLNRAEQQVEAERIIRDQFNDMVEQRRDGNGGFMLEDIGCTHKGDGLFECHASAGRNYGGNSVSQGNSSTAVLESEMMMSVVDCDENGCRG